MNFPFFNVQRTIPVSKYWKNKKWSLDHVSHPMKGKLWTISGIRIRFQKNEIQLIFIYPFSTFAYENVKCELKQLISFSKIIKTSIYTGRGKVDEWNGVFVFIHILKAPNYALSTFPFVIQNNIFLLLKQIIILILNSNFILMATHFTF